MLILTRTAEAVKTITLNQPAKRNALSNYPKTLSSPGFYGGYTPFSDSY